MSLIVAGADTDLTVRLTLNGSAATAGAALGNAASITAALYGADRKAVTPILPVSPATVDQAAGSFVLSLSHALTAALSPGSYNLEIVATDGTGRRAVWTDLGPLTVRAGVVP
jgi:hypothetical protein